MEGIREIAARSKRKKEMEELREISLSHFQAGSPKVQELAYDFFKSMDTDGDDRVDLQEFLSFMRQQGHAQLRNPHFFKEIDRDDKGSLDFSEVMTLYYILKSGRPFCDCCGDFIPGVYFSCVECFKVPKISFNLCHDCYRSKKCNHNHSGRTSFLDNYTLLELARDSAVGEAAGINRNELWTTSSNAIVSLQQRSAPTYSTYTVQPRYPGPNYMNPSAWPTSHTVGNPYYSNPDCPAHHTVSVPYSSNPAAWPASDRINVPYYSNPTHWQWPASNMVSIPNSSNAIVPTSNYSNANVRPTTDMEKMKVAFHAFEAALRIGVTVAAIAACTIM